MASTVERILYASRSLVTGPVYHEMEAIRHSAVRNNRPLHVYTTLLHQSGWFLQWKEGPADALEQLMQRVKPDRRHGGMRVVHRSRGPRLLPDPWSMAIVQIDEPPSAFERRLVLMEVDRQQGYQYSPPAVWRRLSTPLTHPGAQALADTDAFQRVMVCSAHGTDSFDLVRWVAEENAAALVRRRFSGMSPPDIATDYTDIEHGSGMVRLVAMARNGLMLGLTRALLRDHNHVLLLFSGDATRDAELFERVLQSCAGNPSPPTIIGMGLEGGKHRFFFAQAHARGFIYLDAGNTAGDDKVGIWQTLQSVIEANHHPVVSRWPMAAA